MRTKEDIKKRIETIENDPDYTPLHMATFDPRKPLATLRLRQNVELNLLNWFLENYDKPEFNEMLYQRLKEADMVSGISTPVVSISKVTNILTAEGIAEFKAEIEKVVLVPFIMRMNSYSEDAVAELEKRLGV